MSDSLHGMVPELEEDSVQKFQDSFVVAAFEISINEKSEVIVGNLIGISSDEIVKIDIRTKMSEAYEISKSILQGQKVICEAFQLHYAEDNFRVQGPFSITSHKMLDFDHPNKMCILALDLIRETP